MYIGLDIGGTKCAVVLGDEQGNILRKTRFATTTKDETLENLVQSVAAWEDVLPQVKSIGVSCGGPLDSRTGRILSPPNLPGWDDVPITELLTKRFGVPAYLCNDANACALAEWKFGAGQGTQNMIFLTFGTGLGAGLILNGKLYDGTNGMAGEVGHIRLSSIGPVGYGKAGSFEGFCSGGGLAQLGRTLAMEQWQMGRTVGYCEGPAHVEEITAKSIAEAALAGDPTANEVYRLCGEMLGRGLSILIDVLNPECIVIGSVFQRSEGLLREAMEEVIHKETLALSRAVCKVVPAALEESLGDHAALAVAMTGI